MTTPNNPWESHSMGKKTIDFVGPIPENASIKKPQNYPGVLAGTIYGGELGQKIIKLVKFLDISPLKNHQDEFPSPMLVFC